MNLNKVIKEIEQLNCQVVILDNLSCKGRYVLANNKHFIFLSSDTTDIENTISLMMIVTTLYLRSRLLKVILSLILKKEESLIL